MATRTLYLLADATAGTSGFASIQADGTAPSTANSTAGWTVAKTAASNYAAFKKGTKQASSSFAATVIPAAGAVSNTNGNGFRSQNPFNGTFANTAWSFNFALISTTASSQQDALTLRVFRSTDPTGATGLTEITSALQTTTTVTTNTTTAQNSTLSWSPGSLTFANEYLFITVAMKTVVAGGANGADWVFKTGSTNAITTPDYVPNLNIALSEGADTAAMSVATAMAISTLTDDFATLDTTTKWTATTTGSATNTINSGVLEQLSVGTNASSEAKITSKAPYSLVGDAIYIKPTKFGYSGTVTSGYEQAFVLRKDSTNFLQMVISSDGNLHCESWTGNTLSTIANVAYSASTHAWLRYRESGGTVFWDAAPSTASDPPASGDWVNLGSKTVASSWNPTIVTVEIRQTNWQAMTALTAPAKWDGLNSKTTALVTGSLTVTEDIDTAAVSGAVLVSGSMDTTGGLDTAAVSVSGPYWNASVALSEAIDTGAVTVSGPWWNTSLAASETIDTAALAGSVIVSTSLAVSETGSDTATVSAQLTRQGSLAVTEAGSDTAAVTVGDGTPIAGITEDFTTLDTSTKWTVTNDAGYSATVNAGVLELAAPATNTGAVSLESKTNYSLLESSVFTRFIQPFQGTGFTTYGIEVGFGVIDPFNTAHKDGPHFIWDSSGGLSAVHYSAGNNTFVAAVGYSATSHAWLRIRETAGTIYWDTAPDNSGVPGSWTNLGSLATSSLSFVPNSGKVRYTATHWDSAVGSISGPAKFDNLNVTGTLNVSLGATEAIDTAAVSAQLTRQGSLAGSEAIDTAAITVTGPYWNASVAASETGNDTAAIAAQLTRQGDLIVTESGTDTAAATVAGPWWNASVGATESGSDTAAISAQLTRQGSLASTETGNDSAAVAAAGPWWNVSVASTEANDTASLAGSVLVSGSAAATETGADTAALTGTGPWWNANVAATEANDTAAVSAAVLVSGSLSGTETIDTVAVAVTGPYWNASLAASEANDTAALSGSVLVSGSVATTEAIDTAALSASGPWWNASVATTEANDSAALTGSVLVSGSLAGTEDADTASFIGDAPNLNNAALAGTETNDTAALTGSVLVSATAAATEANDTAALSAGLIVTTSLASSEAIDTAAISASGPWWNASVAATEGIDTAAIAAQLTRQAAIALTEAIDTAAVSVLTANAKIGTITDDFTTLDTTKWNSNVGGTGFALAVSSSQLTLTIPNTTTQGSTTLQSKDFFTLAGSEFVVRLVNPIQGTGFGASAPYGIETGITLEDTAAAADTQVYLFWDSKNTLNYGYLVSGVDHANQGPTYNATNHAWLKISESGGTITWWTAPDSNGAAGTWTSLGSVSTSSVGTITNLRAQLYAIRYATVTGTTVTGPAKWDNVNLGTAALNMALAVTESGADTATAAGNVLIAGQQTAYEAVDTATITGGVLVAANLAASEARDSAALSAGLIVTGAIALTEDKDIFQGAGLAAVIQVAIATSEQGFDTFAAVGDSLVTAYMQASEDFDTFAVTIDKEEVVTVEPWEGPAQDTASMSVSVWTETNLAAPEDFDLAAIAGTVLVVGSLASTEGIDTAAFAIEVGLPDEVVLNATEALDTFAAVGAAGGAFSGYFTASVSGSAASPSAALGAVDQNFTTNSGTVNWTHRWAVTADSRNPNGTQTLTLRVRKSRSGTTNHPSVDGITLFQNGNNLGQLLASPALITTTGIGEDVVVSFDASLLDGTFNNLQVEVSATYGGTGGTAATVQVDACTGTFAFIGFPADHSVAINAAETADVATFTGAVQVAGIVDAVETRDIAAAVASVLLQGAMTAPEAADTALIFATAPRSVDLNATEANDTLAASGNVFTVATITAAEALDTLAAAAQVVITATVGATEAADGAALNGQVWWNAAVDASETVKDSAALSGNVEVGAVLLTSEAADTAAVSAKVLVSGALSSVEDGLDFVQVNAGTLVQALLGASEAGLDTAVADVHVLVAASLASSEQGLDTAAIAAAHKTDIVLAVTEAPDTFAAVVTAPIVGALATAEGIDRARAIVTHVVSRGDALFAGTNF